MSFSFTGPHPVSFQGGTFNSVSGDMNVFSTVSQHSRPSGSVSQGRESFHNGDPVSASSQEFPPPKLGRRAESHEQPYNKPYSRRGLHQNRRCISNEHAGLTFSPNGTNSTFNAIGGNMTSVSLTSYGENGLDILYRFVLQDALHNSAGRPPDPSCHPGTRDKMLGDLGRWSQDDRKESSLLWLHGSAGIGKSAIAQTFAVNCQKAGTLGASFFFKRGDTGRGTWKGLFPTVAYQLAASFDELRDLIQEAVQSDKLVFGQSMRHQYQKLIVAPFERAPPLAMRPIIVIDGLDECEDHSVHGDLLKLLVEGLRGRLPARILLVSRPEPHLREILQAHDNFDVCRHLQLLPDPSAHADIHRYFLDEFSRIRQLHRSRGVILENDWPAQDSINWLVEKSSGTFIYAATVLRYIDDEWSHPADRLDSVLALDPLSTAPLDDLYAQILSTVSNRSLLRRVLHAVVWTRGDWDPEEIDAGLQLRMGTSRLVLRGLHSLVSVPPPRTIGFRHGVTLLHASLGDFLSDLARSSDLCVAAPDLDSRLVRSMIVFLSTPSSNLLLFEIFATELVRSIARIAPAEDLLPILQNADVQQVSYSSVQWTYQITEWLKTFSPLPVKIIQTWDNLLFVCQLQDLSQAQNISANVSGTNLDGIYMHILSQNPTVLSVLRSVSVTWPYHDQWHTVLDLLGFHWDVLCPLTVLRTYYLNGRTLSRSLLDFVRDSRRAGALWTAPEENRQFLALRCILRIRQILLNNEFFQLKSIWLKIISSCKPSDVVLHELQDLDLAQLCSRLRSVPDYHSACHGEFLHPNCFKWIVDWLWTFPSPPKRAIEFWKRQLIAVETCCQSLLDDSPPRNTVSD